MPNIQYLKVPLASGFTATVKLMLPPGIDMTETSFDISYPMIVNVYGGPGSDQVSDSFSIGFQHYLITSKNIIYCMIDGRGSSHSGTEQMFTVNNALGTFEIEDQIDVTKYLQDNYGFIDANKTGIWGWSYGGYATAFVLANDVDKVFQGGISVAPVTSWIYYGESIVDCHIRCSQTYAYIYQFQIQSILKDTWEHHKTIQMLIVLVM